MSLDDAMAAAAAAKAERLSAQQQALRRLEERAVEICQQNSALTADFLSKANAVGLPTDVTCWWDQRPVNEVNARGKVVGQRMELVDPMPGWRVTAPNPVSEQERNSLILLQQGWYCIQRGWGVSPQFLYRDQCWFGSDGKLVVCKCSTPPGHYLPSVTPFDYRDTLLLDQPTSDTFKQHYLDPQELTRFLAHLLVEGTPTTTGL